VDILSGESTVQERIVGEKKLYAIGINKENGLPHNLVNE